MFHTGSTQQFEYHEPFENVTPSVAVKDGSGELQSRERQSPPYQTASS